MTKDVVKKKSEAAIKGTSSRREFVRKAGYSAPVLLSLGSASLSSRALAQAGGGFNGPPSAPAPSSNNQLDEAEERLIHEAERSGEN